MSGLSSNGCATPTRNDASGSIPLHSTEWAVRLVLSLRGRARVSGPADLASAVAVAAEAALRAYSVG